MINQKKLSETPFNYDTAKKKQDNEQKTVKVEQLEELKEKADNYRLTLVDKNIFMLKMFELLFFKTQFIEYDNQY